MHKTFGLTTFFLSLVYVCLISKNKCFSFEILLTDMSFCLSIISLSNIFYMHGYIIKIENDKLYSFNLSIANKSLKKAFDLIDLTLLKHVCIIPPFKNLIKEKSQKPQKKLENILCLIDSTMKINHRFFFSFSLQ
jgi:hypothetical protein